MKKKTLILSLLSIFIFTSCEETYNYTNLKGDELVENLPEDNYRNFYEVYVGSFYDSNGDGVGDLKGVEEKLPYIKDLGYNGIWLMPIFESNTYHKYNAANYYQIDEDYGTMDDLISLVDACHELDIKIILDLVLNHCSRDHEWFKKSADAYSKYLRGDTLDSEQEKWKDVFSYSNEIKTGYSPVNLNGVKFYVESNFDTDMPEFNYDSPLAKELMFEVARYYLEEIDVDGYRLDAVIYIYNKNTQKNIEFLNEFKAFTSEIKQDSYIVGEAWSTKKDIFSYYESDLDSYFYFPGQGPNGSICRSLDLEGQLCDIYYKLMFELFEGCKSHIPAPFLDNHDTSRLGMTNQDKVKILYGLLSMLNGTTFTYYGSEIGLTGAVKPDQNVRTYMYWSDSDKTGECRNPIGTTKCEYVNEPVDKQLKDKYSILNYYKHANQIRNAFPIIARGTPNKDKSYYDSENCLVKIVKNYLDEEITILFNLKETIYKDKLTYDLLENEEIITTLLVGKSKVDFDEKNRQIKIPPYGIVILN